MKRPGSKPKVRKHDRIYAVILFIIAVIAASTPFIYQWQQEQKQNHLTTAYQKQVQTPVPSKVKNALKAYNQFIYEHQKVNNPTDGVDLIKPIQKLNRPMGYVKIPAIKLNNMVFYYGDSDKVLSKGLGTVPWTSLPAGGKNTMAGLTGHSGMDQVFFDNIRYLKKGDIVYVTLKGTTRAYAVTTRKTVDPNNKDAIKALYVQPGKEQIAMVTCTPLYINTHRLIVYAKRISMPKAKQVKTKPRDTFSAMNIAKYIMIFLVLLMLLLMIRSFIKSKKEAK